MPERSNSYMVLPTRLPNPGWRWTSCATGFDEVSRTFRIGLERETAQGHHMTHVMIRRSCWSGLGREGAPRGLHRTRHLTITGGAEGLQQRWTAAEHPPMNQP